MDTTISASIIAQRYEMLESYAEAIRKCGGDPTYFLMNVETMTVREMIDCLAQNGVRFSCNKRFRDCDHSPNYNIEDDPIFRFNI